MSDIVYNEILRLEAEKLLREASMKEIRNEFLERRYKKVKTYEEYLKEKAAMDCQRQLLLRLKEKVDGVSERLASERSVYVAKQCLGWKMRQGKAKAELGEGGNGTIKPDYNNA
ncbi:hypothetical protein NC651_019065 [Populus alba x Populus x berolinensis]|nr:hypothetical protein NC651_019065 [Populus alba x Populus x berolinensis]